MHHRMHARGGGSQIVEQAAEVAQAIGVATWFGGQVFATAGLHPGVEVLSDRGERTKVIDEAWRRYKPYGMAGLWLAEVGTAVRSYQAFRKPAGTRTGLAALNVACCAGAIAASTMSGYLGREIARSTPDRETPITTATEPASETPARARKAQRWLGWCETLTLAFGIGLVVSSALLSADAARAADESRDDHAARGEPARGDAGRADAARADAPRGDVARGEPACGDATRGASAWDGVNGPTFAGDRSLPLPSGAEPPPAAVSPSPGLEATGRGAVMPEAAS
jgi:hypothetical protein